MLQENESQNCSQRLLSQSQKVRIISKKIKIMTNSSLKKSKFHKDTKEHLNTDHNNDYLNKTKNTDLMNTNTTFSSQILNKTLNKTHFKSSINFKKKFNNKQKEESPNKNFDTDVSDDFGKTIDKNTKIVFQLNKDFKSNANTRDMVKKNSLVDLPSLRKSGKKFTVLNRDHHESKTRSSAFIPTNNDIDFDDQDNIPKQDESNSNNNIFTGLSYFNKPIVYLDSHDDPVMTISHKNYSTNVRDFPECQIATKTHGSVRSYGINSHQSLLCENNEDMFTVIPDVPKPDNKDDSVEWPEVSYFGLFDGRNGTNCAKFIKENLHKYIFKDSNFPDDPKKAILNGFEKAEKVFMNDNNPANFSPVKGAKTEPNYDRSGTCVLVIIIIKDICYCANIGDSRALLSQQNSTKVNQITKDHRPYQNEERIRLITSGAYIFTERKSNHIKNNSSAPVKIFPGCITVSRFLGDIDKKLSSLGGYPKIYLSVPTIISFQIKDQHDFIVFGSKGLFDVLNNKEIMECAWATTAELKSMVVHDQSKTIVDIILKTCLMRQANENCTVGFICLEGFRKNLFSSSYKNYLQKIEDDKVMEKIRQKVKELKVENITQKYDEKIVFLDYMNKLKLEQMQSNEHHNAKKARINANEFLQSIKAIKKKSKESTEVTFELPVITTENNQEPVKKKSQKSKTIFNTAGNEDKSEINEKLLLKPKLKTEAKFSNNIIA